jgi:hypothetical protein
MTFGQILDRTYRLMRARFRLFMGIAAVPTAATFLVMAAAIVPMFIVMGPQMAGNTEPPPLFFLYLSIIIFVSCVILPLVYALYMPAACYAATQADLGVKVTFSEAYGLAWRRFGRYLWLMILVYLYVYVPVVAAAVLIGGGALLLHYVAGVGANSASMFILVFLLALLYLGTIVYSIYILLRFALAYPASVAEGLTAWDSLQRSAKLTQGAKGRIFLMLLLIYAISYAVTMVCVTVFCVLGVIGVLVAMLANVSVGSPAFFVLISLAVLIYLLLLVAFTSFIYAALTTAQAVLYHDQRLRKDGPLPPPVPAAGMA